MQLPSDGTELFLFLVIRVAVLFPYSAQHWYMSVFSIIQKLHKTRSHYWYILQQKNFLETRVSSIFNSSEIAAPKAAKFTHASYKVLPVQSAFAEADPYCPKHFMMYKLHV